MCSVISWLWAGDHSRKLQIGDCVLQIAQLQLLFPIPVPSSFIQIDPKVCTVYIETNILLTNLDTLVTKFLIGTNLLWSGPN